jgi:hypothetical protein
MDRLGMYRVSSFSKSISNPTLRRSTVKSLKYRIHQKIAINSSISVCSLSHHALLCIRSYPLSSVE